MIKSLDHLVLTTRDVQKASISLHPLPGDETGNVRARGARRCVSASRKSTSTTRAR